MRRRRLIILTLSLLMLVFSAGILVHYVAETMQSQQEVKGLIDTIHQVKTTESVILVGQGEFKEPTVLPQYESLSLKNPDLIGWISIEDTPINYPVMYTPEQKDYYLHRNFDGDYEYTGLPFLDEQCQVIPRSTNLIIYGHNMKNTTMFSTLIKYEDQEYFEKHPTIQFDTIYEQGTYQIISAFRSQVYRKSDRVFKFYQFIHAVNEQEFANFCMNIKELSLYDTKQDANYGDELLTLVTCSYHTENGRFVIVAKRIEPAS